MEGSGSATIKLRSPSQAPRGRGNLSKQKPHNDRLDSLLSKPGIEHLDVEPHTSRIRWLEHVERSTGCIAEVSKLNVVAQKRRSRPTKICDEALVDDSKKLGMDCAVRCLRTMVASFSIQG